MEYRSTYLLRRVCSNYYVLFHYHVSPCQCYYSSHGGLCLFSQVAVSAFSNMISSKVVFNSKAIYHFLKILISFYSINDNYFGTWISSTSSFLAPFYDSAQIQPVHTTFLYSISVIYPVFLVAISDIDMHPLILVKLQALCVAMAQMQTIANLNCF